MKRGPLFLAAAAVAAAGLAAQSPAAVGLAVLIVPVVLGASAWNAHRERLARLQSVFEGGLGPWGKPAEVRLGGPDRAVWRKAGSELELHWTPSWRGRPGETELRLSLPSPVKGLLAVSTHDVRRMAGAFGGPPVKLDEPEFDSAFYVRGTPEDLIRSALGEPVQESLLELKRLLHPVGFELTLGSRELGLYVAHEVLERPLLVRIVEAAEKTAALQSASGPAA